jgi:hypothetical protein
MTAAIPTTDLRVSAQIKASNATGTPAYLLRRGEAERGTILLKLNRLDATCDIWTEIRMPEGDLGWMKGKTLTEAEADDYVQRAIARDPDLWVIEIEDRAGNNPFDGKKII